MRTLDNLNIHTLEILDILLIKISFSYYVLVTYYCLLTLN